MSFSCGQMECSPPVIVALGQVGSIVVKSINVNTLASEVNHVIKL